MADLPPADFYTGIVAEVYAALRSSTPDPRTYGRFIKTFGQPALELGCGDGDPLLALREHGLDVEGLDSSLDMLDRLRAAAHQRGIAVTVHHAAIECMDLGRQYPSIFLAGPTFNLLPDDATAAAALSRIRGHLTAGGAALVPLFVPSPTPSRYLGVARESLDEAGQRLRFTVLGEERDEAARTQVAHVRYEVDDRAEDRRWLLHWYDQPTFTALVEAAGLAVGAVTDATGAAAAADATAFVFQLRVA